MHPEEIWFLLIKEVTLMTSMTYITRNKKRARGRIGLRAFFMANVRLYSEWHKYGKIYRESAVSTFGTIIKRKHDKRLLFGKKVIYLQGLSE